MQAIRQTGSAALNLCYIAAGRLDGYWERGISPWDVAAGAVDCDEAGGTVTDMRGGPFRSDDREILASNGTIARQASRGDRRARGRTRSATELGVAGPIARVNLSAMMAPPMWHGDASMERRVPGRAPLHQEGTNEARNRHCPGRRHPTLTDALVSASIALPRSARPVPSCAPATPVS